MNIGPCLTQIPGATFGVPIGPFVGVPAGETHEAAGAIASVSSFVGRLSLVHGLRVRIDATSSVSGRLQRKAGAYVPGQVLTEPYPVPELNRYVQGAGFGEGFVLWAGDLARWRQEHLTRVMRDMARLAEEKASQWEDA